MMLNFAQCFEITVNLCLIIKEVNYETIRS